MCISLMSKASDLGSDLVAASGDGGWQAGSGALGERCFLEGLGSDGVGLSKLK